VRVLLKFGADPNLPDEFTNIYLVAREKGLNSLQGMSHLCHCCYIIVMWLTFSSSNSSNIIINNINDDDDDMALMMMVMMYFL